MFIKGVHIPRRTVLRGVGTVLALPFLDAMTPAMTPVRAATKPGKRLGVVYVPNGMSMDYWTPRAEGALEISSIMQPLASVRDQLVVIGGLSNQIAWANDGAPHQRAQAAWASG